MSYWDRVRTPQRRRAVSPEAIAVLSAELLDAGGLAAFSLRALAGALGVAPASLYSRIDGPADAHDLALDHVLAEDRAVRAALADGSATLLLTALHRHLRAHPWAVHVVAERPPRGPAYVAWSEALVRALEREGHASPLPLAYAATNLVLGSALTAAAAALEPGSPPDDGAAPVYAAQHGSTRLDPEDVLREALRAWGIGSAV